MNKVLFLTMAIAIAVVMVALPIVAPIIVQPANADGGNTCGDYSDCHSGPGSGS
jgi:hypothetical protein